LALCLASLTISLGGSLSKRSWYFISWSLYLEDNLLIVYTNPTNLEQVKCAKSIGINVSYRRHNDADAWEWNTTNKSAESKLRELGVGKWDSHTKEVPLSVRRSDKEAVIEFLRAYISCDGWANKTGGKGKKKKDGTYYLKPQVGFDTVSRSLALQVRTLLLNLGILSSMSKTKSRKFRSKGEKYDHCVYMVRISGEHIVNFQETIGFIDPNKQKSLEECVKIIKESKTRPLHSNIKEGAIFLREYLKKIDVGEGCKLDSKGNVYKNAITTNLLGDKYDLVRDCWKRKTKSLTREIAKIVVDRTGHFGENIVQNT